MKEITERQLQVLKYINNFQKANNYPPTFREIGKHFNISLKGANDHVQALKRKRMCDYNKGKSRTLFLTAIGREIVEG